MNAVSDNRKSLRDFVGLGGDITSVKGSSVHRLRHNLTHCQRKQAIFGCLGCGQTKKLLVNCYIRICPRCEKARTWRLRTKYNQVIPLFKSAKMLTLTFKGHRTFNKGVKRELDKKAYYFFRRYRSKIDFGIRVMELKKKDDGYHIHYHAIIESQYLNQSRLSEDWKEVTGDSFIVDIRKIHAKWGLRYVLKYATKPIDFDISLDDYERDFYKTRLITMIGSLYGNLEKVSHEMLCEECNSLILYFETVTIEDIAPIAEMTLRDYG